MLIVHGLEFMEAFPDTNLMRQYVRRIDEFSFGVLMLEVLFALWQGPAGERGLEEAERNVLEGVQQAWRSFWSSAVGLFQKFHAEGPGAARDVLAHAFETSGHFEKLTTLCSALRTVSKSLQQQQQQQTRLAASVFDAAVELIDPRGVASWQDLPRQLDRATPTSAKSPQNVMAEGKVPEHDADTIEPPRALVTTAPNWASLLESNVSWAAIGMTRKLLDLAWAVQPRLAAKNLHCASGRRRGGKYDLCYVCCSNGCWPHPVPHVRAWTTWWLYPGNLLADSSPVAEPMGDSSGSVSSNRGTSISAA